VAAYTSQARLEAVLGSEFVAAAISKSTAPLAVLIADASAVVAAYLRNSGYVPPVTENPDELTDRSVALACDALVVQALCKIPEVSQLLPEGWDKSMQVIALEGILSGTVMLDMPRNPAQAVGGWAWSSNAPEVTGSAAPKTSKSELSEY
jgi:hypothetical protein